MNPQTAEFCNNAEATLRTAGFPMSDLVAPMAHARFWFERASLAERKAYTAAGYESLSAQERADFRRWQDTSERQASEGST